MTTQLLITLLVLVSTVVLPVIVGCVALFTPSFTPETPEDAPESLSLTPQQVVLALMTEFTEALSNDAVSLPSESFGETVLAYMGLQLPVKTAFLLSASH